MRVTRFTQDELEHLANLETIDTWTEDNYIHLTTHWVPERGLRPIYTHNYNNKSFWRYGNSEDIYCLIPVDYVSHGRGSYTLEDIDEIRAWANYHSSSQSSQPVGVHN